MAPVPDAPFQDKGHLPQKPRGDSEASLGETKVSDDEEGDAEVHIARLQAVWRNVIVLMVIAGSGFVALISLVYFMNDSVIVDLGYRHFATIFGLPAAAAAALLVVLVTRAVSGPMSVSFLGLNFRGAASETIMWVICFLAISFAVQSTWKLEYMPAAPPSVS